MTGSYDFTFVLLSVLIAIFASYTALVLAGRVTAEGSWARPSWLAGGAAAMGFGIWSMHYIGLQAFKIPMAVAYDWPSVLPSLLVAILASGVALYFVSRKKMGMGRGLVGSLVTGAGIAGMHSIGTHAIDAGSASIGFHFDPCSPQYIGPEYAVIRTSRSLLLALALLLAIGPAGASSPPSPPTRLGAAVNTANLSWVVLSSPESATYNVYRSAWVLARPTRFPKFGPGSREQRFRTRVQNSNIHITTT